MPAIIRSMEISGYAIKQCIAEGGMAAAYLAEQTSLGRMVVLKVLGISINDSSLALRRFMNEGQLLAALRHPNVITIYDIGTASNFVYISMEYVAGGDLKQRLSDGPLAPAQALHVLEGIAQGLDAAHAEGIIHRDVKPGNVLFHTDGTPLLSDFGIAKSLYRDADLTTTGVFLGSPNYMAPEQAEPGEIDLRADIYALGVILYEMLTGQKPYIADSVIDVIHMHKKAPIPRLPTALMPLQDFLELMLAKHRNDRFRNVAALLDYLQRLERNGVLAALSPTTAPTPQKAAYGSATRLEWTPRRSRFAPYTLYGLLGAMVVGYSALFLIEAKIAAPTRAEQPGEASQFDSARAALASPQPVLADPAASVDTHEVIAALLWLGRNSVNQQRLTAPPTESAYYYFSRVLQLDPANQEAHAGIREIAKSYALLAQGAITHGNHDQARAYVAIGRQLDPSNEALEVISELAKPSELGLWATLRTWWRER
ncbi:MAG: serine/threonine protein kinase [Gammaproteobacteria bacterium]|nr:serine/threonine protein kinase [Gammaproteobacteria bacterium]